ncbi:L-2-hydroxyglutarate oxidase [Thalassobacter stenotrophicus]|uniref:L-2-hydroxyglutarate oxidase n=1 Tax=Thalassobacter stenotrophicus TaxID=266809 RepID=UPI0022A9EF94|nr:L-2-hydroxyglutarate oxidase [Thalassobacter stenotrophicus]UYP68676.1 L-2-hydroxyglutarate oxidase [Thalassobacter stenotrophicus]
MSQMYDYLVIGGGIVGASTAMQLGHTYPDARIGLIEKEPDLAAHQTGHNSGVIHAGVYYAPGSMKARFCRAGVDATLAFSRAHNIPVEQCGKMIVATEHSELARMADLHERATQNGLQITRLGAEELSEREPNVRGVGALFVSVTGIANYPAITVAMGREITAQGGDLHLGQTVRAIAERADSVTVETDMATYQTRQLVVCGGLQADRLARMAGLEADFAIVPFRGEYFRLAPRHDDIVRSLIYPVPDPSVPFLGVHLTRMIGGYVTVGPNAVLGLSREGYAKTDVSLRDMAAMAGYAGFWRVMAKNLSHGVGEMRNSLSRKRYLKLCQRYAPGLELEDLQPYPAGIRAQAVARDGTLVHDFLLKRTARMLHVCNAPSPAATSALPIGAHIVETLAG